MSDVVGTWDTVTNTPLGQQKATITLQADGDALTGTMAGAQGTVDIKNGAVDGNKATWSVDITNPMPITLEFSVTADGDSLSGNVKLGAFGSATVTGTRASG